MSGHVLISYSSDDGRDYAARLSAFLTAAGLPVKLDVPVDADCAAFLSLLTPGAQASDKVRAEVATAAASKRPFMTLLVGGEPYASPNPLMIEDVRAGTMPSEAFVEKLRELVLGKKKRRPRGPRSRPGDRSNPKQRLSAKAIISTLSAALAVALVIVAVNVWGEPGGPTALPSESASESGPPPVPPTLVVGVDLQGAPATTVTRTMNLLNLYLDQLGGKAGEHEVELQLYETGGRDYDPTQCRGTATEHVGNEREVAVLGAYDQECTKITLPILNPAPLLMVSHTNTWSGLTRPAGNREEPEAYFPSGERSFARVVPTDELRGMTDARRAAALGMDNVLVLSDAAGRGAQLAAAFATEARRLGLQVYPETWKPPTDPFSQNVPMSSVYLAGFTAEEAASLLDAKLARLGANTQRCLLASLDADDLEAFAVAKGAEGAYVSHAGLSLAGLGAVAKSLGAEYRSRYTDEVGAAELYAVLALQVILAAIEDSDGTRAGVRDAVLTGAGITIGEGTSAVGKAVAIDSRTGDVIDGDVAIGQVANAAVRAITDPLTNPPAGNARPCAQPVIL